MVCVCICLPFSWLLDSNVRAQNYGLNILFTDSIQFSETIQYNSAPQNVIEEINEVLNTLIENGYLTASWRMETQDSVSTCFIAAGEKRKMVKS